MCININNQHVKLGVHDQEMPHHIIKWNNPANVVTTPPLIARTTTATTRTATTRTATTRTIPMMMFGFGSGADKQFGHWMILICVIILYTLIVLSSTTIVSTKTTGKLVIWTYSSD